MARNNVYKYCDGRGLDILEKLELKITPPTQLNDIFEFAPQVICSAPRRMAKEAVRDKANVRQAYYADKANGIFQGTEREYRRFWRSQRKALLAPLAAGLVEDLPQIQSSFPVLQSHYLGVLCLTANPNSVVMWSHYADKHKGIVLEFDADWSVFSEGKGLRRVNYVRERPKWDEAVPRHSRAEKARLDTIFFHKNEEWQYEQELREVFRLDGLRHRPLDDGRQGYFLPVPSEVIVSVCLGMLCEPKVEAECRNVLKSSSLSHVILKKALPNKEEFSMNAIRIEL